MSYGFEHEIDWWFWVPVVAGLGICLAAIIWACTRPEMPCEKPCIWWGQYVGKYRHVVCLCPEATP